MSNQRHFCHPISQQAEGHVTNQPPPSMFLLPAKAMVAADMDMMKQLVLVPM
jgi:hypothetical protein